MTSTNPQQPPPPPPLSSPSSPPVRIVIKNPAKSGDFKCHMALHSSVGDLKGRLEQEYEGNPKPDQMKLIFAGKLLQDNSILEDVLHQHDASLPQTFHLIVRPHVDPQTIPDQSHQPQQPPQQQHPPQQQQHIPPGPGPFYHYGGGGQPGYPGYVYNQFYAQPQMNPQFQQFLQQQQLRYQQHLQQQLLQQQQPQQQQQQPQPVQPQQPQNPNAPRNDGNSLSLLFKLALLVLILSQGGGSDRMVVLGIVAVVVFLYQTGRIRINRVNLPQPQAQDPHNPQAHAGGIISEVALILSSFVYSLFPTWQPPPPVVQAAPAAPNPDPNPQQPI